MNQVPAEMWRHCTRVPWRRCLHVRVLCDPQKLIVRVLTRAGYQVELAENGLEGNRASLLVISHVTVFLQLFRRLRNCKYTFTSLFFAFALVYRRGFLCVGNRTWCWPISTCQRCEATQPLVCCARKASRCPSSPSRVCFLLLCLVGVTLASTLQPTCSPRTSNRV